MRHTLFVVLGSLALTTAPALAQSCTEEEASALDQEISALVQEMSPSQDTVAQYLREVGAELSIPLNDAGYLDLREGDPRACAAASLFMQKLSGGG